MCLETCRIWQLRMPLVAICGETGGAELGRTNIQDQRPVVVGLLQLRSSGLLQLKVILHQAASSLML